MTSIKSASVRASIEDEVLRIRLCRPKASNALDLGAARDLLACCESVTPTGVGSILLEAEGRNFCVGGDVRYFARPDRPKVQGVGELVHTLHRAISALDAAEVPVVSAVQGWCVGAGLGLALVADVVVAADTAHFRSAYTTIGLTPDLGASWHLPRLVGRLRATTFFLDDRVLDASTSESWGMVSQVARADELADRSFALARTLARGPRDAHRGVRDLLRAHERPAFRAHLDAEARSVSAAADSPDGKEGVAAFLARRDPVFGTSRVDGRPAGAGGS